MSFAALLTDVVVVVGRGRATEDEYGNPTLGESTRTSYRGRVQPTDSVEVDRGGVRVLSEWLAFLPAGAVVDANDRIEHEGRTYEVLGSPAVHKDGPGNVHHIEARLRVVEGAG